MQQGLRLALGCGRGDAGLCEGEAKRIVMLVDVEGLASLMVTALGCGGAGKNPADLRRQVEVEG